MAWLAHSAKRDGKSVDHEKKLASLLHIAADNAHHHIQHILASCSSMRSLVSQIVEPCLTSLAPGCG